MPEEINNAWDIIDSRDVIARIEELKEQRGPEGIGMTADEMSELEVLEALAKEASEYAPDWEHGEPLIRDSYFEEYAQELAEDCGMLPDNSAAWPLYCIDWEQAARDLKMDYSAVGFDGVTYWIR